MEAGASGMDTGGQWNVEEQIDPVLFRVRCGELTRWFALVDSDEVGESESTVWPHVHGASVGGRTGLLIPRCEGGLLDEALRRRGGMPAPHALGVIDEVLELLENAPAAPAGGSRAAIRSFAVKRSGDMTLVPGRFRTAAERSDSAELGELLHLALTGSTWEETGVPLSETAPEVPAAVCALVTDMLEGVMLTGGVGEHADVQELRARVARLGPSRDRGFIPAEPGVLEEDAPTGTLSPDVVVALRGAPPNASVVHGSRVRTSRPRDPQSPRVQTRSTDDARLHRPDAARTRRDRRRVERGRRHGRLSVGILVACAACVAAGAVLMGTGAGEADPTPPPPSPLAQPSSGAGQVSPDATREPGAFGARSSGPLDAAVELTRARAEAFAVGDADALAAVTVPGSPAAEADSEQTLGECAGCADALSLSDVGLALDQEAPGASGEQQYEEGQVPTEGQQARVHATMRSAGAEPISVVFVLEWFDEHWRVHNVHPS